MSVLLRPRALLITLDAFGTLYRPRQSIALQYLDVARSCGLHIEADSTTFGQYFKDAFRAHYARSPNYGIATGMKPDEWWANVVSDSFKSVMSAGQDVPPGLAESLYEHFSSQKGYELFPDAGPFFQQLRQWKQSLSPNLGINDVVVGILTNSDPRVALVLKRLGVLVKDDQQQDEDDAATDLDFVLTSYDIGHEKPDPLVFAEAEQMLVRRRFWLPELTTKSASDLMANAVKVHIGDDLHKDYWGAIRASRGWDAILLDRDAREAESPYHEVKHITSLTSAQAVLMSLLQRTDT